MKMASTIRSSNKCILYQPINNELNYNGGEARKPKKPATFISTNPSNININSLSHLYLSCNHSPHRLAVAADVDANKLALAVNHSAVVVSVFANVDSSDEKGWRRPVTVSPKNGELVGFGRAVSDLGLTASIFDVMVIPTLRRLGIGRMIVHRIIRMLTNRGVYDISALCSEEERLFFEACGFGDDLLGSTTMTYTETASSDCSKDQII
ncbi:hypothetical protein KSS87_019437 [Heliosperma pusillum]|nr:hypothetical protein KSS87_019437 [Heliosperma pusillum]